MANHRPPTTRAHRGGRLVAAVTATLMVLTGWVLGAPTASAARPPGPGTLTVTGYDYLTGQRGDVVAGDPDTNLRVRFTAQRALDDGTLSVALPTRDWPDQLKVGDRLGPDDPTLRGSVVVRPAVEYDELTPADCRAAPGTALVVTVSNRRDVRTATVSHLSCAPGQVVTLRVFDVQAPRHVGRTSVRVFVGDAAGGASTVLRLDVRPVPTTRLVVEPSSPVFALTGEAVTFTVTAVDVRGRRERVDTGYRGTVNVIPVGEDCFVDADLTLPVTFTAADRGTKTLHLTFAMPQSYRIRAYDVEKRALPGDSGLVTVMIGPDFTPVTCSRAYH